MQAHTSFIDAAAVEAWDAWFRWRDSERLHDFSVEATWQRVAQALEGKGRACTRDDLLAALSSWRLLLDERILASAGTAARSWPGNRLVAVLNVPMFVRDCFTDRAHLDLAAFESTAELAVRALDDAMHLAGGATGEAPRLRIGLIGLADALLMLGIGYRTPAGCLKAAGIARALAQGCLRGTVRLAAERGRWPGPSRPIVERARLRGLSDSLVESAGLHGVRHAALTAVTSQPRLALFANNVADALEPLRGEEQVHRIESSGQERAVRSSGYALTLRRRMSSLGAVAIPVDTRSTTPASAHAAMCNAVRRWIDEAISMPLAIPVRTTMD
ncbi:hypothetical protein [Dokdonella sp.]|uniref:hypothetical protein n=1 Tax=Dokdonella sp. TaxID=2291710 RepID=UPI002624FBF7|nr:hypothetical protein [Dokdonella sp.]